MTDRDELRERIEEILRNRKDSFLSSTINDLLGLFPTREEIQKEFEAAYWGAETPQEQACVADRIYALFTKGKKEEAYCSKCGKEQSHD